LVVVGARVAAAPRARLDASALVVGVREQLGEVGRDAGELVATVLLEVGRVLPIKRLLDGLEDELRFEGAPADGSRESGQAV
jgi:hypothetical protein